MNILLRNTVFASYIKKSKLSRNMLLTYSGLFSATNTYFVENNWRGNTINIYEIYFNNSLRITFSRFIHYIMET